MDLQLSTTQLRDYSLVEVGGEIDLSSGPKLQEHLVRALGQSEGGLIVDLSGVTFCDSTGLAVLLKVRQQAEEARKALRLAGPRRPVSRVLQVTELDRVFSIYSTREEASGEPASDPETAGHQA